MSEKPIPPRPGLGASDARLGEILRVDHAGELGAVHIYRGQRAVFAKAKDKESGFRLMGFGHRVYKNYDPRAALVRKMTHEVLGALNINDPLLEVAMKLEEAALKDEYFVQRKLYPNVDFYSGIIYKALGIPVEMFTVMFAIARTAGWVSHWLEQQDDPENKIGRPRQIYTGAANRDYVPLAQR